MSASGSKLRKNTLDPYLEMDMSRVSLGQNIMQWHIWSVAGEALNFGGRRMATIMRVAWLPVTLLLMVQMVSVVATLSIALDRSLIEEPQVSYGAFLAAFPRYAPLAWQNDPLRMSLILAGSFGVSLILISSFMAPLVRYAASGVKPSSGLMRLPFGPEQIRFAITSLMGGIVTGGILLAPIAGLTSSLHRFVFATTVKTELDGYVLFPTQSSLHTVLTVNMGDFLTGKAKWWLLGIPISLNTISVVLAVILVWILIRHFHPRNRRLAVTTTPKLHLRAPVVAICTIGFIAMMWGLVTGYIPRIPAFMDTLPVIGPGMEAFALFSILILTILYYVGLRLFEWPGNAVMQEKLFSRNVLAASRGWNLFRMAGLMILILLIAIGIQYAINFALYNVLLTAIQVTTSLVVTVTRMLNSGYNVDWVLPMASWFWTGAQLLVNIFWMFFSYGVLAGLYGRLYTHVQAARPYLPAS